MSVQELSELDAWMSWLSTLGGACSALGDGSVRWADTAASISVRQMTIARRLGDPTIVARCRLYTAIACIQKHQYKVLYPDGLMKRTGLLT
ncbi:hypothetical protein HAZT_HAZT008091 [Hyalella azteca]|uniref:Uncharacterized protein n=1 Tax=Hyalella azteca TaxID=294128 RepID=A0A6A0H7M1_HYAAZ|nr:hypothetical protein HAZT_HAZT008091 [Hyalella azteca]